MLTVGDTLPTLALRTPDDAPAATALGRGGAILYFMRSSDCPLCLGHVRALVARASELAAIGVEVTIVVPDGPAAARQVSAAVRAPFAVVAGDDAHGVVGLRRVMFDGLHRSGTITVGKDGRVASIRRASMPFGAFNDADVSRCVAQGGC